MMKDESKMKGFRGVRTGTESFLNWTGTESFLNWTGTEIMLYWTGTEIFLCQSSIVNVVFWSWFYILDWHRNFSFTILYSHRMNLYLYCTRTEKFLCQSSILRGCVTIHFDCSLRGPSLKLTTRGSQKYATRNWRQYICATFRCL